MSLSKSSIISQQLLNAPNPENNYVYEFVDFRLDAAHLMLYRGGRALSLKPKVVETLVALVEKHGEVVGKDELMKRLWADSAVEESNLTQNIYLLRKTLGNCADGQPFIETFARRGYRFNGQIKTPTGGELLIAARTETQTVIEETVETGTRRNWLLIGAATCALLALAGFAFLNFRNKKPVAAAPFEKFEIKRHTEKNDVEMARISPDGKFIAYTDSKGALWLKNTGTGSSIKILPENPDASPRVIAISPDDSFLYLHYLRRDRQGEIIKMPLFGGVQQKIEGDAVSDFALSPDGAQLAFVTIHPDTNETALVVTNTDGSGERTVAVSPPESWFGSWSQPTAWSPDGSRIACTSKTETGGKFVWSIKIFRASDGAELALIKSDFRDISAVAWLADGDHLLVIGDSPASAGQIYGYTISSDKWRRITNDLNDYSTLTATADSRTVLTMQIEDSGNLWVLPAGGDKNQARQITFGRNRLTDNTGVSWTADGKKIVYASNASGRWEIWQVDADGANQKQLTENCAGNSSCSAAFASPDGRYIVFQALNDGVTSIWRMDADGANARRLTDGSDFYPSVSPDSRRVVYTHQVSALSELWEVPIDGGKPEQFSPIASAGRASLSPDGKQLAFSYWDKDAPQPFQTCFAPVEASAPQKCFANSRARASWAADGTAFFYLDHDYTGIWKQPLDGGRESFLEFPGELTTNFAFSPDGKQLVVARSRAAKDIVALTDEH